MAKKHLKSTLPKSKPTISKAKVAPSRIKSQDPYNRVVLKDSDPGLSRFISLFLCKIHEYEQAVLAQELHNGPGQLLAVIKMKLDLLKFNTRVASEVSRDLEDIKSFLNTAIVSFKKVESRLNPVVVKDFGFIEGIKWQAKELEKSLSIDLHINAKGMHKLTHEVSVTFFRIFQEIMDNILRHASAKQVKIELTETQDWLYLIVEDDGVGIPAEKLMNCRTMGIPGMFQRIDLLAGKIDIRGRDGRGTCVRVAIPIEGNCSCN